MQIATLTNPRAATLADLRPGDPVFIIADLVAPRAPLVALGTVTVRSLHHLTVRAETGAEACGPFGPREFDMQGRSRTRGITVAVEAPEGARRVGSLAVAS